MNFTTHVQKVRPDHANLDRLAFIDALDAIGDRDVIEEILHTIDVWTYIFQAAGFKQTAATNRATELVAEFVWECINLPKMEKQTIDEFPF